MRLLDEKFKKNKARYFLQCGLATLSVCIVLIILDIISEAAIIAALGASSFIAFAMPKAQVSKPRYLIGGYMVGTVIGCICHFAFLISISLSLHLPGNILQITFCSVSAGLTIFIMTITNTEHPPAVAVALGLVINGFSLTAVIVIVVGIVSLALIKTLLMPFLENLI